MSIIDNQFMLHFPSLVIEEVHMVRSNTPYAIAVTLLLVLFAISACTREPAESPVLMPVVDGDWWQVAGNPDLGEYTTVEQEPVDFGVWQASDGTWQLWSCIRNTACGGNTRLFYRWEGDSLTDTDWRPVGIAMEADTTLGEQPGGLQAPHVVKVGGTYYMYYGDWVRICLATSSDGKTFTRYMNANGEPDLFTGPYFQTRDPMLLIDRDIQYLYYCGTLREHDIGAVFCRTSTDFVTWSRPYLTSFGGIAGMTNWAAECPQVVKVEGSYYVFRTQYYGPGNVSTVYRSDDPLYFGSNDDSYRLGTLPVAAPEIVKDGDQYYIAALNLNLDGIRIAKLKWEPNQ